MYAQEKTKVELQESQEQLISARVERDRSVYKLQQMAQAANAKATGKENASPGLSPRDGQALPDQDLSGEVGFIRGYLDRIAHLEKEIRRLKEVCSDSFQSVWEFYANCRSLSPGSATCHNVNTPSQHGPRIRPDLFDLCLEKGDNFPQVQRCSGAFLVSARKASMGSGSPVSAIKGPSFGTPTRSPFASSPLVGSLPDLAPALDMPSAADLGELAEDEEFAAEEHAHRCVAESH